VRWPGRFLSARIAPIIFEIVDAPARILRSVLVFMPLRAGPAAAGLRAGVGIDSEFKALGMNVVAERFHACGKALRVGLNVAMRIAGALPAIVDDDVDIARIAHSG